VEKNEEAFNTGTKQELAAKVENKKLLSKKEKKERIWQ
jgi:hypothetical protein